LPFRTTLAGQALRLRRMYTALINRRRRYRIDGVYWFALRDRRRQADERDWWGWHTGLLRVSGPPKRAWWTLVRLTRRYR
jgi:hypothetical protein